VTVENKRLVPTALGVKLMDYLLGSFAPTFPYDYTARLEATLDDIAAGEVSELEALNDFWGEFQPLLRGATAELANVKAERSAPQKTGEQCPKCGNDLVLRDGKRGQFIGCSAFPKCRYTAGLEHQPVVIQPA
jgi:DNA topoisomerase-1